MGTQLHASRQLRSPGLKGAEKNQIFLKYFRALLTVLPWSAPASPRTFAMPEEGLCQATATAVLERNIFSSMIYGADILEFLDLYYAFPPRLRIVAEAAVRILDLISWMELA